MEDLRELSVADMQTAYFLTHPIQYQAPLIRYLISEGIDLHVVYESAHITQGYFDQGFGRQISWDVPLLDGYPYTSLNEMTPRGSFLAQLRLYRQQIRIWLAENKPRCTWVHGWGYPFPLAALLESSRAGIPVLLRGETGLRSQRGGPLRQRIHRFLLKHLVFNKISGFLAIGSDNRRLYLSCGVPEERIFSMPYAVDNDFFRQRCEEARSDRDARRWGLGIQPEQCVFLYAAKLTHVKAPEILLEAFAAFSEGFAGNDRPVLIFAGDGDLRDALERRAQEMLPGRVLFPGFLNQSELPAYYDLCDAFVLPSRFEPWGLVVNEAMNAGKAIIASDQVASGDDLIREGVNGRVFKNGDATDLARCLHEVAGSKQWRQTAGLESMSAIKTCSFTENADALRKAIHFAQPGHSVI